MCTHIDNNIFYQKMLHWKAHGPQCPHSSALMHATNHTTHTQSHNLNLCHLKNIQKEKGIPLILINTPPTTFTSWCNKHHKNKQALNSKAFKNSMDFTAFIKSSSKNVMAKNYTSHNPKSNSPKRTVGQGVTPWGGTRNSYRPVRPLIMAFLVKAQKRIGWYEGFVQGCPASKHFVSCHML